MRNKREEISFLVSWRAVGGGEKIYYSCLFLEQLQNWLCCGPDDIYLFIYLSWEDGHFASLKKTDKWANDTLVALKVKKNTCTKKKDRKKAEVGWSMGCASSIHISDRVVYHSGKESEDSHSPQQTNTTQHQGNPVSGLPLKPLSCKVRQHTGTFSLKCLFVKCGKGRGGWKATFIWLHFIWNPWPHSLQFYCLRIWSRLVILKK